MKSKYIIFSLILLLLITVAIPVASAGISKEFTKDTQKQLMLEDVKTNYGYINIKEKAWYDLFGWWEKDVAKQELTSHTPECLINCYSEGKTELFVKGRLFDKFDFYNRNSKDVNVDYKIYIKEKEYYDVEVPDTYKEVCEEDTNITKDLKELEKEPFCYQDVATYKTEKREKNVWVEYDYSILDEGVYEWRIEGTKGKNTNVDWIGTSFGVKLEEWAWWNSSWQYKKKINLSTASGSTGTDYQITLNVSYESAMESDFDDLRFLNSDEDTELDYWIETKEDDEWALVWVEIDSDITTSTSSIYMYYGNSGASSTANVSETFIFGDDFSTNTSSSWDGNYVSGGTDPLLWNSEDGTMYIEQSYGGGHRIFMPTSANISIEGNRRVITRTMTNSNSVQGRPGISAFNVTAGNINNLNPILRGDSGQNTFQVEIINNGAGSNVDTGDHIEPNVFYPMQFVQNDQVYSIYYGANYSDNSSYSNSLAYFTNRTFPTANRLTVPYAGLYVRKLASVVAWDYFLVASYSGNEPTITVGAETANKATPTLNYTLDKSSPQTYGTTINFDCSTDSNGTLAFYINDTDFTASLGNDITLGGGYWELKCNVTENDYWQGKTNTTYFQIDNATAVGSCTGTSPIAQGTSANVECTESNSGDGDLTYNLYRNGTLVDNPDLNNSLAIDTYYYVYNTTGGANYSATNPIDTFTLEVIEAPGISTVLKTPNTTYNSSTPYINFTANVTAVGGARVDNATLTIWNSSDNSVYDTKFTALETYSNTFEWNVTGLDDGNYLWNVEGCANDSTAGCASAVSNRTFTIDTVKPIISIFYPENDAVYNSINNLSYNYADATLGWCWYSKDAGTTNYTAVSSGTNFTGVTSTGLNNQWFLYCNDSAGNLAVDDVNFTVNKIAVTLDTPSDTSIVYTSTVGFNVSSSMNDLTANITNMTAYSNESGTWKTLYQINSTSQFDGSTLPTAALDDTNYTIELLNHSSKVKNVTLYLWQSGASSPVRAWVEFHYTNGTDFNTSYQETSSTTGELLTFTPQYLNEKMDSIEVWYNASGGTNRANVRNITINKRPQDYEFYFNSVFSSGETILWNAYVCDDTGFCQFSNTNSTFTMDSVAPVIEVTSPLTETYLYEGKTLNLNWTVTDTNTDSCWYNYNGTNNTVTCGDSTTTFSYATGENDLIFYANDTVGNLGSEAITISYYSQLLSEAYETPVTSGVIAGFDLDILTNGTQITLAYLYYNGTRYLGTISSTGNTYNITRNQFIPAVTTTTNISFYWNVTLSGGTTFTTAEHNQTVNPLGISTVCTGNRTIFNFTMYDEVERTYINETEYSTLIKMDMSIYSSDRNNIISNYSTNFTETNPAQICINSNLTDNEIYSIDLQVEYSATNYSTEFYNLYNYTLTNESLDNNISLYDLDSDNTQEFKLNGRDSSYLPLSDALIHIERKYIDTGEFKVVEIPMTDDLGVAVASLQLNDVIYNFKVYKYGVLLRQVNNVKAICQTPLVSTCQIDFNAFQTGIEMPDFTEGDDFNFDIGYNKSSRILTAQYSIPSGEPSTVELVVTSSSTVREEICTDTIFSSSGYLYCTIGDSFDNQTVTAKLSKDGTLQGTGQINLGKDSSEIYTVIIVFLSLLVFMTLIGIGISDSPVITMVFLVVGIIFMSMISLINSNGFFGAGATILFIGIAVVIFLIKAARRS